MSAGAYAGVFVEDRRADRSIVEAGRLSARSSRLYSAAAIEPLFSARRAGRSATSEALAGRLLRSFLEHASKKKK